MCSGNVKKQELNVHCTDINTILNPRNFNPPVEIIALSMKNLLIFVCVCIFVMLNWDRVIEWLHTGAPLLRSSVQILDFTYNWKIIQTHLLLI